MVLEGIRDAWLGSLARRAQRGDREAFRSLYRALHPAVSGFVGRRVASREDAEDLTSKVFERFLDALASWDPARAPVRAYALAIARNAVIDHGRRPSRATVALDDVAEVLPDGRSGPLDALVSRERVEAVRREVALLPPDLQEMLALRFGDELSHGEIAALLGSTEEAVRQRLSRTVRELRSRIQARAKKEVTDVAF